MEYPQTHLQTPNKRLSDVVVSRIRVLDDFLLCELTVRNHNSLPSVFFLFPHFWETAEEVWQNESKNKEMSTARTNPRCC